MNILKRLIVVTALAPLAVSAGELVDERWDVAANVTVSIENLAGEIVVQAWDRNEVHLTGELGDSVEELEVNELGSGLEIIVSNRDERHIDSTELLLRVPAGANLEASAVSADIDVSGLDNEKLSAASVSGDVTIHASSLWVSIESVSGDVEFSGKTPRISAESVSGDVDLSGFYGEIEATTVSGDMLLQAGVIDSGKLETVSGDIGMTGELSGNGRLTVESMSGDVEVSLPGTQTGLFKAQSFSGTIRSDFGSVEHAEHGPGSHLKHVAGDGDAEIRIESFSGNISIRD